MNAASRVAAALVSMVTMGLLGCLPESPQDDALAPELEVVVWTPPAGSTLDYRSRWDWADATLGPSGEWVFETDLGYRVGVELGVLATISVMLVPCTSEAVEGDAGLRSHSSVIDSSELLGPWIEAFSLGLERSFGSASASGSSYCALHWLAAAQTSSEPPLEGASLALTGWYESPAGTRREFEASVPLAAGGLPDLVVDATLEFDAEAADYVIELVRRPTLALEGEALDELDDLELAYAFVYGLGVHSSAQLVER